MTFGLATAVGWFFGVLAGAVGAAWLAFSLGRWIGTREASREDREDVGPVGSIVGATLALLAFTLAITFNMAHTKHSTRKDLVRADVRAIQTAYDRAMLLPPEQTQDAHALLIEYAQIRAFDTLEEPDVPLARIISRSEQIQHELWLQAIEYREHPQVRFYMDLLSAMTNTHAERVTVGVHDRLPILVWLCLAFITGLVLYMALDLDRPQQGILRVDQGPMMRLAQTLGKRGDS